MAEVVEIKGARELFLTLKELPKGIGKNILRSGVASAASVVSKQAKQNTKGFGFSPGGHKLPSGMRRSRKVGGFPDKISGTLNLAIYRKHIRERSSELRQTYYVAARKGTRYRKGMAYGKGGSKIRAKSQDAFYAGFVELGHKMVLWGRRTGGRVPAYPFLGPAYSVRKRDAVDAIAKTLRRRIPQEALKVAQRQGARRI